MNRNNKAYRAKFIKSILWIVAFVLIDFVFLYGDFVNRNLPLWLAALLGILVAAMLDFPPFIIASNGYAQLADASSDDDQRRTAKITSVLGTLYILVILGALIGIRVHLILEDLQRSEYDQLFLDVFTLIMPVLTTVASILVGFKAHTKNKDILAEEFERYADDYIQNNGQYERRRNEVRGVFEAIGVDTDIENLMEAIESESSGTNVCVDSINRAALSQVNNRHELHLMQLPNIMNKAITQALFKIDPNGTIIIEPDDGFERKVEQLRVPEPFFVEMVNKQVEENQARKSRGGANYA